MTLVFLRRRQCSNRPSGSALILPAGPPSRRIVIGIVIFQGAGACSEFIGKSEKTLAQAGIDRAAGKTAATLGLLA
jgi:hypothetical protein